MCPLISLLPVIVSSLPVAASSGPPLASAALLAVPLRLLSARRNKAGEYGKHGQRPSDNDERAQDGPKQEEHEHAARCARQRPADLSRERARGQHRAEEVVHDCHRPPPEESARCTQLLQQRDASGVEFVEASTVTVEKSSPSIAGVPEVTAECTYRYRRLSTLLHRLTGARGAHPRADREACSCSIHHQQRPSRSLRTASSAAPSSPVLYCLYASARIYVSVDGCFPSSYSVCVHPPPPPPHHHHRR